MFQRGMKPNQCAELGVNDAVEAHGAGHDQHAHQREAEADFIADHLGRGAQRAEQGVLAVGRPAGQRDSVDAQRGEAENDENADVDIAGVPGGVHHAGDLHRGADAEQVNDGTDGHQGDRSERHDERQPRREKIDVLLHVGGREVFLEQELDAVGQGLQQSEGTDAGGSPAVLHMADDLALQPDGVGDDGEQNAERDGDLNNGDDQKSQNAHRRTNPQPCAFRSCLRRTAETYKIWRVPEEMRLSQPRWARLPRDGFPPRSSALPSSGRACRR